MKDKIKLNKKKILIISFFVLLIVYFQYSVTILYDSAHYLNYVSILEKTKPFAEWDIVRGPVFPLIIYIGNYIFGKSAQGLTLHTFIYYLLMIFISFKILKYFCNRFIIDDRRKNKFLIINLLLIILNPYIFGFYHSLLTEFVAITLSLLSIYLSILWIDNNYFKNKKEYIIISLIFAFLIIFAWFLKQPYVSCSLFPLCIAYVVTLFKEKNIKIFLVNTLTLFICILLLIISINVWNKFLNYKGLNTDNSRNPTVSVGNQLLTGLGYTAIIYNDDIYNLAYLKTTKLSKKELNTIKKYQKEKKDYVLINKYKSDEIYDTDVIACNDGLVNAKDSFIYLIVNFFKEPLNMIDGYITGYLSIIDVYSTNTDDGILYTSNKKIDILFSNEINTIGLYAFSYGKENIFYMTEELYNNAVIYKQTNNPLILLNYFMKILSYLYLFIFKLCFLLLPFSLLITFILLLSNKFKNKCKLNLILIMLGFSLLHILLHVITGALIDRYAICCFIPTQIGQIMLIRYIIDEKKNRKMFGESNEK